MFSVFFLKAYRKPRELTWVSGVLLLFLMLGFGFSGYLLPWNELSFFATKVGTGIAGAVPFAGQLLLRFLRGGDDVTGATLSRFYAIHVAILPAITLRSCLPPPVRAATGHERSDQGRAASEARRTNQADAVLPRLHSARRARLVHRARCPGGAGGVLSMGAWTKADPFAPCRPASGRSGISGDVSHAEAAAQPCSRHRGEHLGVLGFGLAAIILIAVPFLDRHASNDEPSPGFTVLGVLALLYMTVFTIIGYYAS